MVEANPNGTGSIQSHIRGGNERNTPYISTTDPRSTSESKNYDGQQIEINTKRLHENIVAGKIKNTQIIPHEEVKRELQVKVDEAKEKFSQNPTPRNSEKLKNAKKDLEHTTRDGECLIKGCVPADYIIHK